MILLISDLHLEEQRPDITRAFLDFLQHRAPAAEALYILGDFFEVWVGDDAISPFQREIATALRQLSDAGTRLYLMHGNRDFMLGKRFCREAGCTLLRDPSVVELEGHKVLLMHGDSLCTLDVGYMKLRRWLRNPLSLFVLRNLPLATRQRLARKLRERSQQQTRMKASAIVDVTPSVVPEVMAQHGVLTLIHGHTHRPAVHRLEVNDQPAQRIVLGDWDQQGWALQIDQQGFHLAPFAFAP
ncbi:MAG: UDP-2,3-diacylglucosamine diphosphatase [Gammaproteobacteria bacterium]|nr:UDP-2,3-diacylglucosamine diphosphatase [Gammaproteobacteria bacterium]MBU1489198.1 UDP-2,3-diacylglucosamine diphosphatase [Gammaproteobacteria bacterium]MBU2066018.1 UDP-2,3-diacylglucosamine diphosphatase [Gammaproteobacteria bacterium]MBU2138442.1 UDP-2,3-diacylglucosamine diphosphatase [Gammaproteobacteria bacterium]